METYTHGAFVGHRNSKEDFKQTNIRVIAFSVANHNNMDINLFETLTRDKFLAYMARSTSCFSYGLFNIPMVCDILRAAIQRAAWYVLLDLDPWNPFPALDGVAAYDEALSIQCSGSS